MRVVVASSIRTVRDAIAEALEAIGYKGVLDLICVNDVCSMLADMPPTLLFIAASWTDGAEVVSDLRAIHPALNVGALALSGRDEELIGWAGVGISGYVEAEAGADAVAAAIIRLLAGETVFPPRLSSLLVQHFARRGHPSTMAHDAHDSLTRREGEVAELVADGLSNKQIARRLCITDATVKNHVHSILEKFNVPSRGAAAAQFRRVVPWRASYALGTSEPGRRSAIG